MNQPISDYAKKELSSLNLNKQQKDAVLHTDGAVLLLAVPGSGKTTVIVTRLGYMITAKKIPPEKILTLTFTVAAAAEMKSRFEILYGSSGVGTPEFRTINGMAQKILNVFSRSTGRNIFELLSDEKKQTSIVSSLYRETTGEYASDAVISDIKRLITFAKNNMLSAEEIQSLSTEELPFGEIYALYTRYLRENRLMDYDDQLVYALSVLKKYSNIAEYFRRRYTYVCVDEAQDTSKIQHEIIRFIASGTGNLFMVGDEDQSIYGFRGAYPEYLLSFTDRYPNALVLKSEENFRSVPEITEAADRFIGKNNLRINKHMYPHRKDSGEVREIRVYDMAAQYHYLAKALAKSKTKTAVLYRNNECAVPLINLLLKQGTDYTVRDCDCVFFSNRTVLDILSFLRLAQNPADSEAFMKIYYKLGLFLGKQDALSAVRACGGTKDILKHLLSSGILKNQSAEKCERIINSLESMNCMPPSRAVFTAAHLPGYASYIRENGSDPVKSELLEIIAQEENSIDGFLKRLAELEHHVKAGSSVSDTLTLSTVHSAKGLEFDCVYIICACDGILPADTHDDDAPEKVSALPEEERRMFYVAATRAKNSLNIFTFKSERYSSSFADEYLGKEVKKNKNPPAAAPVLPHAGFTLKSVSVTNGTPNDFSEEDFNPGTRISHRFFGKGRIIFRNGDTVTVDFDSGSTKKLSLSHVKAKSLVRRVR